MANDSTTTLNSFHPSSIDDITEPSPDSVIELFDSLDQWGTAVTINDREETYLVGRLVETGPRTFELYYEPESTAGTGVAGTIAYKHHYDAPEEDCVAFQPAPEDDGDDDAQPMIPVQALRVDEHTRSEQLDAVLPLVRDDLMETDWVVDPAELDEIDLSRGMFLVSPDEIENPENEPWLPIRGDAGYGEWVRAMNILADFRADEYDDDAPFALRPQTVLGTKVTHGIARYPLDATRLVSHVDDVIADAGENPEALRTLLIDYAVEHVDLDTVDVPLTAATINV